MGRELGRISGPLLAENLLRNGNNLAFESKLLYLDVVNGYIGVNTDTPTRTLVINGKTNTTNLTVDTLATIANLEISTSQIQNVSGGITLSPNQSLNPTVNVPRLTTASFDITTNTISNSTINSNITLDPMGTGQLVVTTTNVDVRGSLHATGNITWDGAIVFGNDNTDNVTFSADVNSSIIPDVTNTNNIGSVGAEWRNLYSHNLSGNVVVSSTLTVGGINVLKTQGQTIYVSVNGNDSKTGTHLHDPYLTIKKALSVAVAGDKIVIFPGIYTEIFPLTVPQGVSVCGTSLRSVVVKPTDSTRFNDAFLLNGETTVSDLTVGNFYYNATNNTGYGFRLATNCIVTTRSPYIQNVTILNSTSTINFQAIIDGEYSTSTIVDIINGGDSLGVFADITDGSPGGVGGSGRGALVDGSVVNASSKEATILFNSVTMIVPDADGVTATNGARVEWLNSFTYFAYRGIYLLEGTLGFASLATKFGAEMRSISSSNIYGTYGAVADGVHTLGYLIGHNFGYIGSGLDSQNDYGLVEQANEIVAINGGKLYYDSVDQKGDYRIGDIFLVEQSTGKVSFNAQAINYTASGTITLEGAGGRTFIHAPAIEVGNIRIHDNNVDSQTGPVNILAYSGSTYLNTNVNVTGNTSVTGDTNIKGTLTQFGNEATDTVTIYDQLTQTVSPKLTNTYTLGKLTGTPKIWNTLYARLLNVDNTIQVSDNTLATTSTNTDLQLNAAGTGIVSILKSVDITNNLTVTGTSDLQAVGIVGTLDLPGAYTYTQTGAISRTGATSITGNITVNETNIVQFQDIKFDSNKITTTLANNDLTFTANGTGIVKVINSDVQVDNNLAVSLTGYFGTVSATTATANAYDIGSVYITGNTITTDTLNTNLILSANGTGIVNVADSATITNNLEVLGTSGLQAVGIVGTLDLPGLYTYTHVGDASRTGATSITGSITAGSAYIAQFQDIKFDSNKITTTLANNDLKFTANGTGIVKVVNSDVQIDNDLAVSLTGYFGTVGATTVTANAYDIGSVYITGNTITTDTTNTNLVLRATGTSIVNIADSATITNNLTVNGNSSLASVGIVGDLDLTGTPVAYTYTQTGDTSRTGNTNITGNITVNGVNIVQFPEVKFDSNKILTFNGNTDLKFTANGTGIVKIVNSDVQIDNDLAVSLTGYFGSAQVNTQVTSTELYVDSVYIVGNTITTTGTDTNLILSANGTGKINVATTDVTITNNLTVNGSSTLADVGITGTLSLPGAYTYAQTGNNSRTGNTGITGTLTVNPVGLTNPVIQFQNINITNNTIATTVTNSDLILKTAVTTDIIDGGAYSITIDNTVDGGNASVVNLQSISGGFSNLAYDNIINVVNTDVQINNNLNVNLTLNANSVITTNGIPAVDFNVGSLYIKNNISVVPTNTNLVLSAYTGKTVHLLTSDVSVLQNLTVAGPFTADGSSTLQAVTAVGTITQTGNIVQTGNTGITGTFGATGNISVTGPSSFLSVNNVKIDANVIGATTTNANLEFRANGTGGVVLERYLKFTNNTISNIFDSNNIDLAFNNLILAEDGQNLILESGDFYLADTLLDGDFSIKFVPNGTGNLRINSNKAFAIAYGNNSNRLLADLGEIRQNSTTKVYEGKSGAGNVSFTGIYDTDGNTYVTAGDTDNILRFGVNGTVKATVSSTNLFSDTLHADNVRISGTTIDNLVSSNDLILAPNGTGTVKFNNVSLAGNKITNNTNTALVFENTGTGYVKFEGTYGLVAPRGLTGQRANLPEIGETRYNTTVNYLEVYDGTNWIAAGGSSNVATLDEIQAELDLWSLVLG
jgi:hypothetical protein